MSAALFDPDDIMREVRAKANFSPAAKTANLLKNGRNFSSLAKLAGAADDQLLGAPSLRHSILQTAGASAFMNFFQDAALKTRRSTAGFAHAEVWNNSQEDGPRTR